MRLKSEDIQEDLQCEVDRGNSVAKVVITLIRTNYGSDRRGFRTAIDDATGYLSDLLDFSGNDSDTIEPRTHTKQSQYKSPGFERLLDQAGTVAQIWDGKILGVPNKPGPLASMAVLGGLGALGGAGIGSAINYIRGAEDPKIKRRWAMMGGAAGLLPGLAMGIGNSAIGEPFLTGQAFNTPKIAVELDRPELDRPELDPWLRKLSTDKYAFSLIPINGVNDMVWNDPRVASRMGPTLSATTSMLVQSAAASNPAMARTGYVTAGDVARVAVGMGSGYLAGKLVGDMLGGLFGISPRAQDVLRTTGATAGMLRTVIPLVYP